jgi:RNA polymerase sigma factor (sigma-70 family)
MNQKGEPLETLLRRLWNDAGREESFRLLFERFHWPLFRFFERRGFAIEECQDLIQETFLRVFRGLETFRGESRWDHWLFRIAANTANKAVRHRTAAKRAADLAESEELEDLPAGESGQHAVGVPLRQLLGKESRELLERAVARLPGCGAACGCASFRISTTMRSARSSRSPPRRSRSNCSRPASACRSSCGIISPMSSSEDDTVDEKRIDLKSALRDIAGDETAAIGPHVGSKRLTAYRQGTLSAAEREALQEHLSLCARCTGLLRELQEFESDAAQAGAARPESLREEAWDSLVQALPSSTWKAPQVRPIAGARQEATRSRRVPNVATGAAAAVLLALAGISLFSWITLRSERERLARLEQQLAKRQEEVAVALALSDREADRVKELESQVLGLTSELEQLRRSSLPARAILVAFAPRFALRGQEPSASVFLRADGAVNPVRIPAQADRFTVALNLPGQPAEVRYRFELLDRNGKTLWSGERLAHSLLGDAGTSVSITGLGPGRYRLRVEGQGASRGRLLGEYVLEAAR